MNVRSYGNDFKVVSGGDCVYISLSRNINNQMIIYIDFDGVKLIRFYNYFHCDIKSHELIFDGCDDIL